MSLFVCGTDTGVGKTILSAALFRRYAPDNPALRYWKPVQTGDDDDRAEVLRLSEMPEERAHANLYKFQAPLSPHRAAELEHSEVSFDALIERYVELSRSGPLLLEGAGGLLVPLNRRYTWLDFLERARLPVVLAARSGLGTINHSLLTLAALRSRAIPVAGVVFCGTRENPDNFRTVAEFGAVSVVGCFSYAPGAPLGDPDPAGLLAPYLRA
jgi:dethiobiotin synthase